MENAETAETPEDLGALVNSLGNEIAGSDTETNPEYALAGNPEKAKAEDAKKINREAALNSAAQASRSSSENNNKNSGISNGKAAAPSKSLAEHISAEYTSSKNFQEGAENGPGNAALVIIYCEENRKFYLETKPFWYGYEGHENKIAVVGGHVERGENPGRTVMRETVEEVSEPGASIILRHLDPNPIYVAREYVDGTPVRNYIFYSKIPLQEWGKLEASGMTADAGHKTIMTLEEIIESKGRWAFYHYDIIIHFIERNLHVRTGWKKPEGIEFKESYAILNPLSLTGIYRGSGPILTKPEAITGFQHMPYGQLKYAA